MEVNLRMEEAVHDDIMPVVDTEAYADDEDQPRRRIPVPRAGSSSRRAVGAGGVRGGRFLSAHGRLRTHSPRSRINPLGKATVAVDRFRRTRSHPYRTGHVGSFDTSSRSFPRAREQRTIPFYHDLDNPEEEGEMDEDEGGDLTASGAYYAPGDGRCVVQFSNLDPRVRDSDIKNLCAVQGKTITCKVIYDTKTGVQTGQAFAEFVRAQDAARAVRAYGDMILDGRPIICSLAGEEQAGGASSLGGVFNRLTVNTSPIKMISYRNPRPGSGDRPRAGPGSVRRNGHSSERDSRGKESFNRRQKPQYNNTSNKEVLSMADLDQELENYMKDDSN
ncbi:hypothetical protein RvY_05410 [Ramazzottius varieornatus]|uniref:RRM domain-containing protein n=1 Tax=Ramazzottius varieornatus TaxID=947166 RepID=A0A1D1UYK5_RAMVA|nr:hypothetical protein RvY_05410 [Ramazzottius varieornatus]